MTLSVALKTKLVEYLQIETGFSWSYNAEIGSSYGFVNFYKTDWESQKTLTSPYIHPYTQYIEFGITFHSVSKPECDNKTLEFCDKTVLAIRKLRLEGLPNNLERSLNYVAPTLFRGITLEETKKEIQQLSTGNQSDSTDQLWEGNALIYASFRL